MCRHHLVTPLLRGETYLIASQATTPSLAAFCVRGDGDISILPIYDWPFEGVPASLGPRLRTASGARRKIGEK